MSSKRDIFMDFLKEKRLYSPLVESLFDIYFKELVEANQKVNLFSRKSEIEELWTRHFLDSLSIIEEFKKYRNIKVLDFGTGGGLPGIPLKIIYPDIEMTLLDSTKKKINMLKLIVSRLNLDRVSFLTFRLEGKEMEAYHGYFDIIVTRAVRITPLLQNAMKRVLNKDGIIFTYK